MLLILDDDFPTPDGVYLRSRTDSDTGELLPVDVPDEIAERILEVHGGRALDDASPAPRKRTVRKRKGTRKTAPKTTGSDGD